MTASKWIYLSALTLCELGFIVSLDAHMENQKIIPVWWIFAMSNLLQFFYYYYDYSSCCCQRAEDLGDGDDNSDDVSRPSWRTLAAFCIVLPLSTTFFLAESLKYFHSVPLLIFLLVVPFLLSLRKNSSSSSSSMNLVCSAAALLTAGLPMYCVSRVDLLMPDAHLSHMPPFVHNGAYAAMLGLVCSTSVFSCVQQQLELQWRPVDRSRAGLARAAIYLFLFFGCHSTEAPAIVSVDLWAIASLFLHAVASVLRRKCITTFDAFSCSNRFVFQFFALWCFSYAIGWRLATGWLSIPHFTFILVTCSVLFSTAVSIYFAKNEWPTFDVPRNVAQVFPLLLSLILVLLVYQSMSTPFQSLPLYGAESEPVDDVNVLPRWDPQVNFSELVGNLWNGGVEISSLSVGRFGSASGRTCKSPRLWLLLVGHYRTMRWVASNHQQMLEGSEPDGCYFVVGVFPDEITSAVGHDSVKYAGYVTEKHRQPGIVSSMLAHHAQHNFRGHFAWVTIKRSSHLGERLRTAYIHEQFIPFWTISWMLARHAAASHGLRIDPSSIVIRSRPDVPFLTSFDLRRMRKFYRRHQLHNVSLSQVYSTDAWSLFSFAGLEYNIGRPLYEGLLSCPFKDEEVKLCVDAYAPGNQKFPKVVASCNCRIDPRLMIGSFNSNGIASMEPSNQPCVCSSADTCALKSCLFQEFEAYNQVVYCRMKHMGRWCSSTDTLVGRTPAMAVVVPRLSLASRPFIDQRLDLTRTIQCIRPAPGISDRRRSFAKPFAGEHMSPPLYGDYGVHFGWRRCSESMDLFERRAKYQSLLNHSHADDVD